MKIGVISDSHGNDCAVKKAVEIIDKVDLWLHAGDHSQDAEIIRKLTMVYLSLLPMAIVMAVVKHLFINILRSVVKNMVDPWS